MRCYNSLRVRELELAVSCSGKNGQIHIIKSAQSLRDTQTLRAGCTEAEPKIFAPPQTPFQGTRDGQNLIN